MKKTMTPEEALIKEAVRTIRKALKEKERQEAIINALKETIAYETSNPEIRIDEEGDISSIIQTVRLKIMKDLEERKRKLLRDWILRECFPKELRALEIIKEEPMFPMYVRMYENAYEMIMDRPGFAVNQSAEELQKEFDILKEYLK